MLAQLALHLGAGLHVERRERLVEQQRRRLAGQRAGERDALRLAAGELPRMAPGELGQRRAARATSRQPPAPRAAVTPRERSPNATLSTTRRCGNSRWSWNTTPSARAARAATNTPAGRCRRAPDRRAGSRPPSSASSPATARSSVDLPAPFGPSTASTSPGSTVTATSARTRRATRTSSCSRSTPSACAPERHRVQVKDPAATRRFHAVPSRRARPASLNRDEHQDHDATNISGRLSATASSGWC